MVTASGISRVWNKVRGDWRKLARDCGGNLTLFTALSAIPVIASAGIAIDYARGVRSATDLQQVADAAGLAAGAATNLTGTTAQQLSQRSAIATSFINDALQHVSDVELIGSPTVTARPSTIDIKVKAKVKGSLINVLNAVRTDAQTSDGSGGTAAAKKSSRDINLTVNSKVVFTKDSYLCLLALNLHQTESIYFQGNSKFMATCAVQANSDAPVAMRTWGNAEANAEQFFSRGGWAGSGFEPDPDHTATVKEDPYAGVTLPAAGSCITAAELPGVTSVNDSGNDFGVNVKNTTATLKPGTYCGGLHVKIGVANLEPGLYIIKDGTLDVDAQSELHAKNGVTFYLTCTNSTLCADSYIDIMSGAIVEIKAPTAATAVSSTASYKGMAIMQDRTWGAGNTNTLFSKGGVNIEGAFYTPKQKLVVWANDTMNGTSSYFPMIVDTLNMNGTATLYVNLDFEAAGYAEPTPLKQAGKVFVSQ